jgi:hypothetical protein
MEKPNTRQASLAEVPLEPKQGSPFFWRLRMSQIRNNRGEKGC